MNLCLPLGPVPAHMSPSLRPSYQPSLIFPLCSFLRGLGQLLPFFWAFEFYACGILCHLRWQPPILHNILKFLLSQLWEECLCPIHEDTSFLSAHGSHSVHQVQPCMTPSRGVSKQPIMTCTSLNSHASPRVAP